MAIQQGSLILASDFSANTTYSNTSSVSLYGYDYDDYPNAETLVQTKNIYTISQSIISSTVNSYSTPKELYYNIVRWYWTEVPNEDEQSSINHGVTHYKILFQHSGNNFYCQVIFLSYEYNPSTLTTPYAKVAAPHNYTAGTYDPSANYDFNYSVTYNRNISRGKLILATDFNNSSLQGSLIKPSNVI